MVPVRTKEILNAHALSAREIAELLATEPRAGLSEAEATRRLRIDGPNRIEDEKPVTLWKIVARQFTSFLIAILILAGSISSILGETADSAVIFTIMILNAALGAYQEVRAERALRALKRSVAPTARVVRDGTLREIPASDVVRGDLVAFQAGDLLPADLRLTETHSLLIDESPLTGESEPVGKSADQPVEESAALADRINCGYLGTRVSYGRGAGIVFGAGMGTQLGQIARMVISEERAPTPLQEKLSKLGRRLGIAALALCGIIFITGLLRDEDLWEMFLVSVSLAVAAVPEGLPAVVTIALALGLQRMLKRRALVRRLGAVETLGETTVICTDKTGTLTRGVMQVDRLYLAGEDYFLQNGAPVTKAGHFELETGSPLHRMLLGMALCNDATVQKAMDGSLALVGSPTEVALVLASQRAGLEKKSHLESLYPRMAEAPFDSERKRMATAHRTPDGRVLVFAKGAPDAVLQACVGIVAGEGAAKLDDTRSREVLAAADALAAQGYRLLAVAYRENGELSPQAPPAALERDLTFLGLAGLIDPPRPETARAVADCQEAGIKVLMITGDHAKTAMAIASAVGMLKRDSRFLTGPQMDRMGQKGLKEALDHTEVFARVSPNHKLWIVEALQERGEVVAMIGDGSNDAPALKKADIGIAMGIRGSDVCREAADMVLTDDNFHSIVAAVHEGRVIYSNIRKVVLYLLSCNVGEILAVFAAMISGLPLLLKPIQILWLNLVTDGLPALALSVEPEEPGIMGLPPRDPKESILTGRSLLLAVQGCMIAAVTLAAFVITLGLFPHDLARSQTAAFVTLTLSELCRAYAIRVELVSVLRQGLWSNRALVGATFASAALLFAVVYLPPLQPWFGTVPLSLAQWAYVAPFALLPFAAAEITRLLTAYILYSAQ